jgi:hypothetical protein
MLSYAVGIAGNPLEIAEFNRIARKTYSTDVGCRQLSCIHCPIIGDS